MEDEIMNVSARNTAPASPLTVANALDRVVRMYPNSEAAVDGFMRLTYTELDDLSRRFASQLRENGVVQGQPAALLTMPSVMHLVSWLAVMRLGGLPLTLHTRESPEALAAICEAYGATVLIHDASMEEQGARIAQLQRGSMPRVRVRSGVAPAPAIDAPDCSDACPEKWQPAGRLPQLAEDDPAGIMLSSGTSAMAKGVIHTHRNIIEAARSAVAMFGSIGPGARGIVPYSTSFTGCYIRWLSFLHGGGCNVFLEHFDLAKYIDLIGRERITHMALTPTMWRRLLASDPPAATFAWIQRASFSGEPMDRTTLERIRERVTPNMVQGYGATEIFALATMIEGHEMTGDRLRSVGRPFPSTEVRLVEPGSLDGVPVLPGEVGEIWVNSPSVASGLWRNPQLEEKLFHHDGERRWWRSADLGRFDQDGFLYVEGRHDDMIISGGINIMPAAIEEVLMQHPLVREVGVAGAQHPEWGEQPHAFIVPMNTSVDKIELDTFMKQSNLSNYQRPRAYHIVESLPRTSSGKVDRRQLREIARTLNRAIRD